MHMSGDGRSSKARTGGDADQPNPADAEIGES